ncbi:hypothetical protein Y032_0020g88 [Ancylostoma ceylanicum]|nr:hypothetical protein Y032_0020g88 [Ancylostoma ceylanicum]
MEKQVIYRDMADCLTSNSSANVAAGISTAVVGAIGNTVGIILMMLILKTPSFHNAFGYLCISHLVSHIGVYSANIFWAAPALILEFDHSITHSFFGVLAGVIENTFWYAAIYSLLQMSLNRLIAIAFPLKYNTIFSPRNLTFGIAAVWTLSVSHCCIYFWSGCHFLFSVSQLSWVYPETECGEIISFYLDFCLSIFLITAVFIIDAFTFVFIRRRAKELSRTCATNTQEEANFKKNIIFFIQGCLGAINQALGIFFYHYFIRTGSTKWQRFAGTSLIFQFCHITDALITIIFIKPVRDQLCHSLHLRKETTKIIMVKDSAH